MTPAELRRWTRAAIRELGEPGPSRRATLGAVMRAVSLLHAERRGFPGAPGIAGAGMTAALAGGARDRWARVEDACDEADRRTRSSLFSVRGASLGRRRGRSALALLDEAARMDLAAFRSESLGVLYETALAGERRGQGSYYTPPDIARYIVRRAMLAAGAEGGRGDRGSGASRAASPDFRIIDPSCGAGLFLAVALDEIAAAGAVHAAPGSADGPSLERVAAIARLATRQLHGIDRDPQAAHLARIVLSLKTWELARSDHQAPFDAGASDWRIESGDALTGAGGPRRAFDLVIGNPPYLSHRALPADERERYRARGAAVGAFDVAMLFTEAGLEMLAPGGALGFLVSNKFMASDYGERLRRRLLEEYELREIADLSTLPLFRRAAAYAVVLIASRPRGRAAPVPALVTLATMSGRTRWSPPSRAAGSMDAAAHGDGLRLPLRSARIERATFRELPGFVLTPRLTPASAGLVKRILAAGDPLPARSIRCGVARSGFARALIDAAAHRGIELAVRDEWVPILTSGDVRPFRIENGAVRFIHRSWLGEGHRRTLHEPKLLFAGMSRGLSAAVDSGAHALGRVYYVRQGGSPESVAYLAGIFNSRVMTWCYLLLYWSVHLAGGYLRVNGSYLQRLPVPRAHGASRAGRAVATRIDELARAIGDGLSEGAEAGAPAREELESLVAERFQLKPADRRRIDENLREWQGTVSR